MRLSFRGSECEEELHSRELSSSMLGKKTMKKNGFATHLTGSNGLNRILSYSLLNCFLQFFLSFCSLMVLFAGLSMSVWHSDEKQRMQFSIELDFRFDEHRRRFSTSSLSLFLALSLLQRKRERVLCFASPSFLLAGTTRENWYLWTQRREW